MSQCVCVCVCKSGVYMGILMCGTFARTHIWHCSPRYIAWHDYRQNVYTTHPAAAEEHVDVVCGMSIV